MAQGGRRGRRSGKSPAGHSLLWRSRVHSQAPSSPDTQELGRGLRPGTEASLPGNCDLGKDVGLRTEGGTQPRWLSLNDPVGDSSPGKAGEGPAAPVLSQ